MPHKHNAARRHRICKMKFTVTNWREYEAGLRHRGSLTLWLTPEALAGWAAPRRTTRGGQPRDSDLAIEATLTFGMVFGLPLRQGEGLLGSVLKLMGLDLPVPDHTTLSRRARRGDHLTDGEAAPFQQKGLCTSSSIAPGLKSTARASSWRRMRCQISSQLA